MTTKIDLGQGTFIDLGTLIATRALVCANSGGGKSWLIRRIVEGAIATIPTVILDREGEFATLREHYDVVLVGQGGEVACAVATAAKLARKLVELRVSAVIDLSDLAMAEKRRFVRLFLEALIALPRSLWHPTLIVIDEAHQFAPESGREAESLAAVVSLMDQGRKRGFGGILATQRLAKLHKDAAAEANNLFVGRFAQDVDLKRAGELLGFAGREHRDEIRTSAPGAFYAIGPALEQPGVVRFKAGSVKTTHPDPQHRHAVKPPQPSKRILAVAGELADLKQQVEAEANELEALRAKVRTLEGEARRRPIAAPSPEALAAAEKRGYDEGRRVQAAHMLDLFEREMKEIKTLRAEARTSKPLPISASPRQAAKVLRSSAPVDPSLGKGAKRAVLTALVQHGPLARRDIGLLTCLVSSAGSFGNVLGELKALGWIDVRGDGKFEATSAGVRALGDYEPLPTGRALVDYWLAWVGQGGQRRMLEAIIESGTAGIARDQLGTAIEIEPSGGTFAKYLSQLRTAHLVESGRGDRLRAAETLREAASA